jgi:Sulfotransferase family
MQTVRVPVTETRPRSTDTKFEARRRLVFLHIPKCGGTTIYSSLSPLFNKAIDSHDHSDANVDGSQMPFVSTHTRFVEINCDPEKDWLVTSLRNPVARLRSLHSFWASMKLGPLATYKDNHALAKMARELPFHEFVNSDHPLLSPHTDNVMVRHFSRVDGLVTESHLEEACKNIASVHEIMFVEDLGSDLMRVAAGLGRRADFQIVDRNITKQLHIDNPDAFDEIKPDSGDGVAGDQDHDEALIAATNYDSKLFNFAKDITLMRSRCPDVSRYVHIPGLKIADVTPNVRYNFRGIRNSRAFCWGEWSYRDDPTTWVLGGDSWLRFKVARSALGALPSPSITLELEAFLPSTRRTNSVDISLAGDPSRSRVVFLNEGRSLELREEETARDAHLVRTMVIASAKCRVRLPLVRDGVLIEDPGADEADKAEFASFRIDFTNLPCLPGTIFGHEDARSLGFALNMLELTDSGMLDAS